MVAVRSGLAIEGSGLYTKGRMCWKSEVNLGVSREEARMDDITAKSRTTRRKVVARKRKSDLGRASLWESGGV
jgi:hypothetical protein